jgi:hypothetical protein
MKPDRCVRVLSLQLSCKELPLLLYVICSMHHGDVMIVRREERARLF